MGIDKLEAKSPTSAGKVIRTLDEKIQSAATATNGNFPTIYKVNQGLRRSNPEAYTPMLVSIGPYHHTDPNLLEMEEIKFSYLHYFLARRVEDSVERYMAALLKSKHKLFNSYSNLSQMGLNVDDDSFIEMMLLDGCFVVEFIRRYSEIDDGKGTDDPIFAVDWMRSQICRDLLLVENQLPFFFLLELYDMSDVNVNNGKDEFVILSLLIFSDMFPKLCAPAIFSEEIDRGGIKHLLHLVHIVCLPPTRDLKGLEGRSLLLDEAMDPMHCVKELEEAGINFKKVGKVYAGIDSLNASTMNDKASLFDIKFDNGLMEIPSLKVEDSTDTFFRNLIAYEQHSFNEWPKYFSDYAVFMDQLINTAEDVNVLRRNGIIVNLLGDDGEVATLFNKLCDGVTTKPDFYYLETCDKVNEHCSQIWNIVLAKLRHDYFNSPWATVSTIAAVFLLILTVIQTVASVIPLYS